MEKKTSGTNKIKKKTGLETGHSSCNKQCTRSLIHSNCLQYDLSMGANVCLLFKQYIATHAIATILITHQIKHEIIIHWS